MNPEFPFLAIVIPAYNEAETIESTVSGALKYAHVIVANDCSTDNTEELARKAGAIVVNQKINQGYDAALGLGISEAFKKFEFVITFDADGQHPYEVIPEFVKEYKKGNHLVLGVRQNISRISENIFALYSKIRFGIKDPLCGMKGYSAEAYKQIGHFDRVKSMGSELMVRLCLKGIKYSQISIFIKDRADDSRMGNSWSANKKIFRSLVSVIKIDLGML